MPDPIRPMLPRLATVVAMLALATVLPSPVLAQAPIDIPPAGERLYEVELADGSRFVARIVEVDGDRVVFLTAAGTRIEAGRRGLRSLSEASGEVVDGRYWRPDPNESRLFFAPTGRTLAAGQGYLGTSFLVLPFVATGVTDHLTFVVGAPVTLGELMPIYLAPKLRIVSSDGIDLSVGSLVLLDDGNVLDGTVGIAFAGGTVGSGDRALTVGAGWGWAGGDFQSESVAMIGGEVRMGPNAKLITENYLLPIDGGGIWMLGIRFIGEGVSADLGMAGANGGCCLPLLNMTYAFGGG